MKIVIQRVSEAQVMINSRNIASIDHGLVLLLGIGRGDGTEQINSLTNQVPHLRIFADEQGKMNLSAMEVDADLLVVPEFTLYGDCSTGRRPSFQKAESYDRSKQLFRQFVDHLDQNCKLTVETGRFGGEMDLHLVNNGPVTFVLQE